MTFFRKRALGTAIALAFTTATLATTPAFAQRAAADVETARQLYNQGRELRDHGDLVLALEKFKAAHALAKTPITGLELARTHAALNQPVEARELCLSVARIPVTAEETARSVEARNEAAKIAEEMAPKIATLRIKLHGARPGDEVILLIDGATVPPLAMNEPRSLDPGAHAISARIGAGEESKATTTLKEGETRDVELTVVPPPKVVAPVGPEPTPARTEQRSPLVIPGLAVAALGVGVGAITGVIAIVKKSQLETSCLGGKCGPAQFDELDRARLIGNVSTVAFIVGAAGGAVVIYGLTHPTTAKANAGKVTTVQPFVGVGSLGFHGSF